MKKINDLWLDGYDLEKLNELYATYQPIKETTEEQYRSYFEFANPKYENYRILKKHEKFIRFLLVSNYGNIKFEYQSDAWSYEEGSELFREGYLENFPPIPSTLVKDGPNKGIHGGKIDHYREILFPGLQTKDNRPPILSSTQPSSLKAVPFEELLHYVDDKEKNSNDMEIPIHSLPIKRYVFKTYRLVAETWCNNPDPKIYTTVHHIGNDCFDNKSNLLFVTNQQHLAIRHVKPLEDSGLSPEEVLRNRVWDGDDSEFSLEILGIDC